jgi:uncharacterized protein (DUF305 family)
MNEGHPMKRILRHLPAVAMTVLTAAACASAPAEGPHGPGQAAGPQAGRPDEARTVDPGAPDRSAGPRIVQPGAPGEATRTYEGGPLDEIEGASHTEADVRFMQGMIHHHAQALEMTALVPERTTREGFRRMVLRMEISQTDEIGIMQTWLADRGEAVPHGGAHGGMPHVMMPGMLSPEQMQQLFDARGAEFERLFLELMIQHHQGAIVMVRDLFDTPGAAQESTVNFFANEVDADQTIEIQRMRQMLEQRR